MFVQKSEKRIGFILPIIIALSFFLARPGFLGEYTGPLYISAVLIFILYIIIKNNKPIKYHKSQLATIFFFIIYWIFRCLQTTWLNLDEENIIKSAVTEIITVFFIFTLRSDKILYRTVFDSMGYIISILGISCLVSLLISYYGFEDQITYFSFSRSGTDSNIFTYKVQFPFSILYGDITGISGDRILRYSGGFSEAGIYPAFGAFFSIYFLFKKINKMYIVGTVLGTLTTMSITAVISLPILAMYSLKKLLLKRIRNYIPMLIVFFVIFTFILISSYILIEYIPNIGLNDKSVTHSDSIEDRFENIKSGVQLLSTNFFGIYQNQQHEAICLLAATKQLGLIGLILWILKYLTVWGSIRNCRIDYFFAVIALVITLLFSQPLFDGMPFVIMLLLYNFQNKEA